MLNRVAAREDFKTHPFKWWRLAVAGEEIGGPNLPIHDGHPQLGFYRRKLGKRGPVVPVAIYRLEPDNPESELLAIRGKEQANPNEEWLYCCRHPISYASYQHAIETGQWSDTDPASAPRQQVDEPSALAPKNHNEPADGYEIIRDQIASARDGVLTYAKIDNDNQAARAQSLRARLNELAREADKKREELKAPHFQAGKAIDLLWQPLIKDAKKAAVIIANSLSAFETARAIANAKALEPAPLPDQIRGGYGRAATIKTVRKIVNVNDWNLLFQQVGDDVDVQDAMVKVAQRKIDRGQTIQGVTIEEQRKVA